MNSDAWTGQIMPPSPDDAGNVTSDLLRKGGEMQILLPNQSDFSLPIVLHSENGRIEGVLSSYGDWVDVTPGDEILNYTEVGSATVTLRVMLRGPREIDGVLEDPPEIVTFDVTWSGEDKNGDTETLTSTFMINTADEEELEQSGRIITPPLWYSPQSDIVIYLDGAATIKLNDGVFPAMTRYETDGVTTVLYGANYITVEKAGVVFIDLSDTGVSDETIKLSTMTSECIMTRVDMISSGMEGEKPFIVGDDGASLMMPYVWANLTPVFQAWKLVRENGTSSWVSTDLITCAPDAGGDAFISAEDAPAGTYKLTIRWDFNGHTLFSETLVFFVRHNSGGQGSIAS